jgi:hypothetical protein
MDSRTWKTTRIALLFALLLVFAGHAAAQSQSKSEKAAKESDIIACRFTVLFVEVEFVVKDQAGNDVANLRAKNFSVYEDGIEQQIDAWHRIEGSSYVKHKLRYIPADDVFDGKNHFVRILVRTDDDRNVSVLGSIRLDLMDGIKVDAKVSPFGFYSIKRLSD